VALNTTASVCQIVAAFNMYRMTIISHTTSMAKTSSSADITPQKRDRVSVYLTKLRVMNHP
jgi:hypothetical protein